MRRVQSSERSALSLLKFKSKGVAALKAAPEGSALGTSVVREPWLVEGIVVKSGVSKATFQSAIADHEHTTCKADNCESQAQTLFCSRTQTNCPSPVHSPWEKKRNNGPATQGGGRRRSFRGKCLCGRRGKQRRHCSIAIAHLRGQPMQLNHAPP